MGNCADPFNVWVNPTVADSVWTENVLPGPVETGVIVNPGDPGSVDLCPDEPLVAPCGDFALGVTILIDGVPATIVSVTEVAGPCYNYELVEAVSGCNTITFQYDPAIGCLEGSVSGAQLGEINTVVDNNTCGITLTAANGTPDINGGLMVCTAVDQAAYYPDPSADRVHDQVNTANSRIPAFRYAEFLLGDVVQDGPGDHFSVGWRRSDNFANVSTFIGLLGLGWDATAAQWQINLSTVANLLVTPTYVAPPASGDVVGIYFDGTTRVAYFSINGTWLDDGIGGGGDPDLGGAGWLVNEFNGEAYLYIGCSDVGACIGLVAGATKPVGSVNTPCEAVTPPSTTVSDSVGWLVGLGAPLINQAVYRPNGSPCTVYDDQASDINTVTTSSVQHHAAFEIVELDPAAFITFGWRRFIDLNKTTVFSLIGAYWDPAAAVNQRWGLNQNAGGGGSGPLLGVPDPVAGTIIEVAIDAGLGVFWINVDGNWLWQSGWLVGGDPDNGGPGWPIANPGNRIVLSSSSDGTSGIIQATKPLYTPSGFIEVT